MRKYRALKPLRIHGRNVAPGEVVWLGERIATLGIALGLLRLMPDPVLLRSLPIEIETKAGSARH